MPIKKMFPPEPMWKAHYAESEFADLLSDRANWPDIQDTLQCSVGTLRYWAKKFGFSYKRGRKARQLERVSDAALLEMYEAAWSVAKMARAAQCDTASLKRRFRDMGKPIPKDMWARFYSEEELRRLLTMFPVGWDEVIVRCDVNRRTVYRWCHRLSIPTPSEQ